VSVQTTGVFCFGLLVGFITYRTLIRATTTAVSDLAAVIAAVGGGAVSAIAKPGTDMFGWYAIALLAGFIIYGVLFTITNGVGKFAKVMGQEDVVVAGGAGRQLPSGAPRA
jgi:hypothetical protein